MANYVDQINLNGNVADFNSVSGDRYYQGEDLTVKFASEISNYSDVWAWIKARIIANNYSQIHTGDYIPFNTTNSVAVQAQVAGIDTYYRYGDSAVGHHIDFISRTLWPTTVAMNLTNFNNGVIPIETLSGDDVTTVFELEKHMLSIDTVMLGETPITAYTYDPDTHTITFEEAPADGENNVSVTGTGSQHPWLASNAYAFVNSKKAHVVNGTGVNPAITVVDYTAGGIYFYLPEALKNVIVEKRIWLPARYNATSVLSVDNTAAWQNVGKLWIPSEVEVAGTPVWGNAGYGAGGFVQYPLFAQNMHRVKDRSGSRNAWWVLSASSGGTTFFAFVHYSGIVSAHYASTLFGVPLCFRISG